MQEAMHTQLHLESRKLPPLGIQRHAGSPAKMIASCDSQRRNDFPTFLQSGRIKTVSLTTLET
jgi:hypothetical protein